MIASMVCLFVVTIMIAILF